MIFDCNLETALDRYNARSISVVILLYLHKIKITNSTVKLVSQVVKLRQG